MRRRFAMSLLAFALSFTGLSTDVQAQSSTVQCDAFVKNSDDSWSALRNTAIKGLGESLTIREGSVLRPGAAIKGLDLAAILDQQCPVEPEPPPASVQAPAPQPAVQLGRYADTNGAIDAKRLSCGQLADASPQEAEVFLAWHSGWYNGLAKKRGINLSRVRNAVHMVVDYCRGNRDKSVGQVMDLMLK